MRSFGDQLADTDHLEAVVAVFDHVDVWGYPVEDGEVVGGECAYAAVGALLEGRPYALEAGHGGAHGGAEVVGELGLGLVEFVGVAVGVNDGVGADLYGGDAALEAGPFHALVGVLEVDVEVVPEHARRCARRTLVCSSSRCGGWAGSCPRG